MLTGPLEKRFVFDLSSNPVVILSRQNLFKHPKRDTVNKVQRVALSSVKNQVVPCGKRKFERLALVTSEHYLTPQQTGHRPFLCNGLHLFFVSPQMRADSGAIWSSLSTRGSP
jgi:hypothetical protein